jgi:phosphoribosylformylglycinamidine synthase
VNPILSTAEELGVPVRKIGTVGGEKLTMSNVFDISMNKLRKTHENWLPDFMNGEAE